MRIVELSIAFFCLIIGLITWAATGDFSDFSDYGPDIFPKIIAVGFIVSAVIMFLIAIGRIDAQHQDHDRMSLKGLLIVLAVIITTFLYLSFIDLIGFFVGTASLLLITLCLLSTPKPVRNVVYSLSITALIWGLFEYVLLVPMPAGELFENIKGFS